MTSMEFVRDCIRKFDTVGYKNGVGGHEFFRDCITYLGSFYRICTEGKTEELEAEYNGVKNRYKEEVEIFFRKFAVDLAHMLEEHPKDYLGEIYQGIGANNKNLGQFYTPSHISEFIGQILNAPSKFDDEAPEKGPFYDPCCGSGSLLIGNIKALKAKGVNYAQDTMAYATDIDRVACYMCYLQLSLLGAAAIITQGNSLLGEVRDTMPTLAALVQEYYRLIGAI